LKCVFDHFGDLERNEQQDTLNSFVALPLQLKVFMLAFGALASALACFAQTPQPTSTVTGSINGTVIDQSGAVVVGAQVRLVRKDPANQQMAAPNTSTQTASAQTLLTQESRSGENGEFTFSNVAPGDFQLIIASAGFSTQTISGTLHSSEVDLVPQIVLPVAPDINVVKVGLSREDVELEAAEEIKVEEKQRVLGMIPNFYVSYIPNAAPLTPKQKFKLAVRTVVDPFTFVMVAGTAGIEQAQNHFIGYGQGTEGYAKRFGAGYADTVSGTFIGGAILPALLKQDPRYFYKGKGSTGYRALYAIANALICKGDNRRWQPNYSNILGSIAAGGISNIYYPAQDRNGAVLTFVNAGIGIGSTAASNLLQEFLIRKLTPAARKQTPDQP
jgi:hypothetical protein